MKSKKRISTCPVLSATVLLLMGMAMLVPGVYAQDLPKIADINPVPRGSAFSPVVDQDGRFIEPRSGPLEAMDDDFIVIGDVKLRLAPTIRFLTGRDGFPRGRSNFTPGTFVEYLINDTKEVYAVWPSSGN